MGVEPFLVAIGDRRRGRPAPGRKLCERCKEAYQPDQAELAEAGFPEWLVARDHRAVPPGRVRGVRQHRLPRPDRHVRGDADDRRDRTAHGGACICRTIKAVAVEQGMITLRDDGLEKVRLGLTSIEEVARVVK